MNIDDKLYTLKYAPDEKSHICPDFSQCAKCSSKICTIICPAQVYKYENDKLIVNYENCLECGACRIACEKHCIDWEFPKGNKGVTFKQG